jgi:hypothetical protein
MPVRFLRNASELADVSMESPLPVQVTNARPVPADTLLVATTTVTTDANRDLLGSTSTELPTLDGCGQYRKLVWFYFRASGADTTYRVLARATDHNGAPLGTGWQELATGRCQAARTAGDASKSQAQATATTTSTASKFGSHRAATIS